jgi:hypothetical protein
MSLEKIYTINVISTAPRNARIARTRFRHNTAVVTIKEVEVV